MHGRQQLFLVYKHRIKILFVIIASVLLVQINYTTNNNNRDVLGQFFFNDQKQPMLTYENIDLKFKINYPNNWEKSVKINNEIIFIAPRKWMLQVVLQVL